MKRRGLVGCPSPPFANFFGIVEPENVMISENDSEARPEPVTLSRGDLPAIEDLYLCEILPYYGTEQTPRTVTLSGIACNITFPSWLSK